MRRALLRENMGGALQENMGGSLQQENQRGVGEKFLQANMGEHCYKQTWDGEHGRALLQEN